MTSPTEEGILISDGISVVADLWNLAVTIERDGDATVVDAVAATSLLLNGIQAATRKVADAAATKYLVLGFSTLLHLIEDGVIVHMPRTFLWPLLGWDFSKNGEFTSRWIQHIISSFYTDQYLQITEIIGLIVISYLMLRHQLYIKANLIAFIKAGRLKGK